MASVPEIGAAMTRVLEVLPIAAARLTGFVQRQSKLTGAGFVQTTVLGWLIHPDATLEQLSQTAAALGIPISAQGLDQRFTSAAADLLETVLDAAVGMILAADPVAIPLLRRFTGVCVQDSSVVNLPAALANVWRGCGGSNGTHSAALKLAVRLDLLTGCLTGPWLSDARLHDRRSPVQEAALPVGALRLSDLGFFSLANLRALTEGGVFFLTRLFLQTRVFAADRTPLDLLATLRAAGPTPLDRTVRIGATDKLLVRLIAVLVPQEVADQRRRRLKEDARRRGETLSSLRLALANWTILVTNVPAEKLSVAEALVLARVRWPIELLFKLWKSHGRIDAWRTANPHRIRCEVCAKLIAMVLQHWLLLTSFWTCPERSLVKAAQTVRAGAVLLLAALAGCLPLATAITQIQMTLAAGCRMNRRHKEPNAYQLLLQFEEAA